MAGVILTMLPDSVIKSEVGMMAGWLDLGVKCRDRTIVLCPTSKGDGGGDHLKEHIDMIVQGGPDPAILIGSALTRKGGVSALGLVEDGTEAHPIEAKKAKVLRFTSGGAVVFRKRVNHPGTPANRFVERAMQSAVVQAGGAAFGV